MIRLSQQIKKGFRLGVKRPSMWRFIFQINQFQTQTKLSLSNYWISKKTSNSNPSEEKNIARKAKHYLEHVNSRFGTRKLINWITRIMSPTSNYYYVFLILRMKNDSFLVTFFGSLLVKFRHCNLLFLTMHLVVFFIFGNRDSGNFTVVKRRGKNDSSHLHHLSNIRVDVWHKSKPTKL